MGKLLNIVVLVLIFALFSLSGCQTIPKDALKLSPESLKDRQLQTRKYESSDEDKILASSAGLLQDMGFNLDESETELGVIVASKMRSAVNAGQQFFAFLAALGGSYTPTDKEQKMRASVVTRPIDETYITVRVTFQRVVWDTQGNITKREGLNDQKIYQEFFDKLSKSIFLEAHEI